MVDCTADHSRRAGFLCKNQIGGLSLIDCSDTGSAYGLVVEHGGNGMKIEGFVSDGATRRALQMVGNDADVGITIMNFAGPGRPVLLGITEGLEFVDALSHVEDLKRYRARGYTMKGNRIDIVTDHDADLVEVHPPSRGTVDLGGVTVERCPQVPAMANNTGIRNRDTRTSAGSPRPRRSDGALNQTRPGPGRSRRETSRPVQERPMSSAS